MRVRAKTTIFTKKTRETNPRLHPNSSIMGLNMTPNAYRAPALKKRMMNAAPTIYHP
jgi:hypothetical protein